jgi:hypothetical protein
MLHVYACICCHVPYCAYESDRQVDMRSCVYACTCMLIYIHATYICMYILPRPLFCRCHKTYTDRQPEWRHTYTSKHTYIHTYIHIDRFLCYAYWQSARMKAYIQIHIYIHMDRLLGSPKTVSSHTDRQSTFSKNETHIDTYKHAYIQVARLSKDHVHAYWQTINIRPDW